MESRFLEGCEKRAAPRFLSYSGTQAGPAAKTPYAAQRFAQQHVISLTKVAVILVRKRTPFGCKIKRTIQGAPRDARTLHLRVVRV
jgi:hypothetical protein